MIRFGRARAFAFLLACGASHGASAFAAGTSSPSPAPSPAPGPAPVFEVAIGADPAPLAGEAQNRFLLKSGGGPSSIDVDAEGRWWVLDTIASRVVVLERDGTVLRTIALPPRVIPETKEKDRKGKKAPKAPEKGATDFRPDLTLDGQGGMFVLNATARRIEHYDAEGKPGPRSIGAETLPKEKNTPALLELPDRLTMTGGELFVADQGSDNLLRFGTDGGFLGVIPGGDAAPATGGSVYLLGADDDGTTFVETWPEPGLLGIPGRKRVAKIVAAAGKVLHDTALLGATASGEAVLALVEGTDEERQRVRVVRYDRTGKIKAEKLLPVPMDDANPTRRWRVTRDGKVAWFRIEGGKFQAFELEL